MQTEKEFTQGRAINSLKCESVGEYALPDYNGDVKKILLVKTQVFPAGKFVGEDLLEFSGSVGYEVVYVDGENRVTHTEFTTDYEAAVRINSESYIDSDIKTSVSACNMRLIGPRKLSVKSSLDNEVRISERREYAVVGDVFSEHEPEYVSDEISVFTSGFASGEVRDINEEIITIDGAIADEVEILVSDVDLYADVATKTGGTLEVKGSLKVGMLYKNGEDEVKFAEREIPYSDELELDSAYEYDDVDLRIDVANKKASVVPGEDGVSLCLSMNVSTKAYAKKNIQLDVITDAYLKEKGVENEHSEIGYTKYNCTEKSVDTFDTKSALTDFDLAGFSEIVYADASAKVEKCELSENSAKIFGEIRFSAIACQTLEEGIRNYLSVKFSSQFEQNVNINSQICDNTRANCAVDVKDVAIQIAENEVMASCTLCAEVNLYSDEYQRCLVASVTTEEEYLRDGSVVTVYYPDASESLFEIAKRFHTSVAAIAGANRLTESVFASSYRPIGETDVKKLLIK